MPKVTVTCQECGKEFEVASYIIRQGKGKYCSRTCLGQAQSKIVRENHPNWKLKNNRICEECGKEFHSNNKSPRYCSINCKSRYQSTYNRGVNNPTYKGKIKRNCQTCGKEFEVYPSRVEYGQGKFCSKECMITRIKKNCEECGKEFLVIPSLLKMGYGKYCSRQCQDKARSKIYVGENHPNYKEKVSIVCQTCKKTFYVNQGRASSAKYCSIECEKDRIKRNCLLCGKEFEIPKSRIIGKRGYYCCRDCYYQDRTNRFSGENNASWQGGISFEPYCPKFNNKFRERVRVWFNYQCSNCEQPQNDKKLCVHHVYYNKQACCEQNEKGEYIYTIDNEEVKVIGNPNKFVALCKSCHTKTNHNRVYWARYFEDIINNWYGGQSWIDV